MKIPFLSNTQMKFLKEPILYQNCFTRQETTQKSDNENKHSVKDRLGLVNVNNATVVKVARNLIVFPGLGFDEKWKLTTKLDVEPTVFSVLFKTYINKIFENKINFKKSLK
jgi:hypothetical protein